MGGRGLDLTLGLSKRSERGHAGLSGSCKFNLNFNRLVKLEHFPGL